METITFSKVVENSQAGVELVKGEGDGAERAVWTGRTANVLGNTRGYFYNFTRQAMQSAALEDETEWRVSSTPTATLNEYGLLLLNQAAASYVDYGIASRARMAAVNEMDSFKKQARDSLVEWAESNLSSDTDLREFSEVLESIGLEGIKRTYTVQVSVTYSLQFEVEASSEEAASEEVDNNLSDYIYDAIDTSYYEDYNIESVDEA